MMERNNPSVLEGIEPHFVPVSEDNAHALEGVKADVKAAVVSASISEIKSGKPVIDERIKPVVPPENMDEMFGHTCRDCINKFRLLDLTRKDCKYDMLENGHRVSGPCHYCGRNMALVMGLTLTGKLKAFGH